MIEEVSLLDNKIQFVPFFQMAAEYLDMQQKLEEMRKYKADLEKQLAQQETQMDEIAAKSDNDQVKKFVQLQKEKVKNYFCFGHP